MFIALMLGFHISEKNLLDCISECDFLLKYNKDGLFLKRIGMSDEKQILCSNMEQKR